MLFTAPIFIEVRITQWHYVEIACNMLHHSHRSRNVWNVGNNLCTCLSEVRLSGKLLGRNPIPNFINIRGGSFSDVLSQIKRGAEVVCSYAVLFFYFVKKAYNLKFIYFRKSN